MADQFPGPDGFLFSPDDPLFQSHLRLSDYLLSQEQSGTRQPSVDAAAWKRLPKQQVSPLVEAVLLRYRWLCEHDADLETGHLARLRLAALLRVLHTAKGSYDEPALCRLLDLTTPLLGRIEPYGPVERVRDYLQQHDLTERLCAALRQFQGHLREEMSCSQTSLQSLRQTLHVLLWQDEWEPMDPARCWSECVRRDFRAMAGDRRVRWRQLLKHIRGNAPVRMPASWAREASGLLTTVTIEDFADAIDAWFAPFRSGSPLPLSVAGSHVLKGLIWYCAVGNRPELKERALWLLHAQWRQKRNIDKALVALSVFGVTKEDLRAAHLIKPEPPAPPLDLFERLAHSLASAAAAAPLSMQDRVRWDGDTLVVQGQLHFYRLSRTGRIVRVTDGVDLDLHWLAVPDQWRLRLHRECDSDHQLVMRASLLVHDAIFGRYFQPAEA